MHPPNDRTVQRWARAGPWTRTGIQDAPTLPCPALALSSHPLWTVHSHIVEEPPKHKRIDWGNLLEIFCYIISNGLSTSRLTLASLFLERTHFSPSGNMHYISDHLSPCPPSVLMQVCVCQWKGSGEGGAWTWPSSSSLTKMWLKHGGGIWRSPPRPEHSHLE